MADRLNPNDDPAVIGSITSQDGGSTLGMQGGRQPRPLPVWGKSSLGNGHLTAKRYHKRSCKAMGIS
jgi:hypothetical protein